MNDYLSPDELRDLTGYAYAKPQIEWLRTHGWKVTVTAKGKPKVLRAYRDHRMGPGVGKEPVERKRPNFAAAA